MRALSTIWLCAVLSACQGPQGEGPGASDDGGMPAAASDGGPAGMDCAARRYFNETGWPQVFSRCAGCHVPGGASGGSRFVLRAPGSTGELSFDFDLIAVAARSLTQGTTPLLLLKPTGKVPHGGGMVIAPGTPAEAVLVEMVRLFTAPEFASECTGAARSPFEGLVLADGHDTLRKAALQLVGRAPTDAEYAAVEAGDPATLSGLDAVLAAMMTEEPFYDRLREMWNDVLLTDKFRVEATYDFMAANAVATASRPKAAYCDQVNWFNFDERTNTPEARECLGATESLAREPLELIAHVVRTNRPFTEILTAQYRYLNAYGATLFGLDPAPWAGHATDAKFYAEARIPALHGPGGLREEYAGVLTTQAFLYRYRSTSSNRNRGRAYQVYKLFLDHDVMKSASRLDLSTIDLTKSPWRYDAQCTGCHASIDPVAGAFQHWTDCYDNREVQYYTTRYCGGPSWYPDNDMFAPGVGAGDAAKLPANDLPTALAHLGAAVVADPAFARSVATHVIGSLTGQVRLSPPSDPGNPDYAALAAAADAQDKLINQLASDFAKSGFDFKKLVIAVVKSPAFRAASADKEGRAELTGLGGGALTPPEIVHRKIASLVGASWSAPGGASNPAPSLRDPPHWLLSLQRFRLFAGGIDSDNVRSRSRTPGALSAAVMRRMSLEMACQYTAYDFALDRAARHLFPKVDRQLVPSGNAAAPDQQPILDNLKWLHERLWGERVTTNDDPELLASYQLLVDLQKQGMADIAAKKAPANLVDPCTAKVNLATGVALPQNQQFSADPQYVVRAWQGLIAYLLMDYRFGFEP